MFIPVGAQFHFGCVFDVAFSEGPRSAWMDVFRLIRSWISRRYPSTTAFGGNWFLTGGEWSPPKTNRVVVRTEAAVGAGNGSSPDYWAVRYEHPCEEVTFRQWRTDMGLALVSPQRYRFSLATTHWLLPGFIGEEPLPPAPTAPRVVRSILDSPRWTVLAGSQRLTSKPIELNVGDGEAFRASLENPERRCPLILVSRERDTDLLKLNPTRLASLLTGAAAVFVATSPGVEPELDYLLPKAFRCTNGAVRVYEPSVRFTSEKDSKRHRFFRSDQIEATTEQAVEAMIVRGIARRSRAWTTDGVASIEDVINRRRDLRLHELRQTIADTSLQDRLSFQDQLIEAVDGENKSLTANLNSLKDELEITQMEKEGAEQTAALLQAENETLRKEAFAATTRPPGPREKQQLPEALKKLPRSLPEVVDLITALFPDRIVFTPKARRSAGLAALNRSPSDLQTAWTCLWFMCTVLYDLLFSKRDAQGIAADFYSRTGFRLTFTESKETKRDKDFMKLRSDTYNSQQIDITPHVKYDGKSHYLRVHFYALHDRKNSLIVVGHCGDHLDTAGTRRLT